jgi:hypothetical protein
MEQWSGGVMGKKSSSPIFHYSNISLLHYFFAGVAESRRTGQVGRPVYRQAGAQDLKSCGNF